MCQACHQIADGLTSAPSLYNVTISCGPNVVSWIHTLGKNPSLKEIRLTPSNRWLSGADYKSYHKHYLEVGRLKELVVFQDYPPNSSHSVDDSSSSLDKSPSDIILPSNPAFVPMAYVEDGVRNTIWDRILHFALDAGVCEDSAGRFHRQLLAQLSRTRSSVPLVCKSFKVMPIYLLKMKCLTQYIQRLSDPYIYGHLIFQTQRQVLACSSYLLRNPSVARYIHTIQLNYAATLLITSTDLVSACIVRILWLTSRLTRLCALQIVHDDATIRPLMIDWQSFSVLACTVGPVLDTLENITILGGQEGFVSPSIFGLFLAIRSLECRIYTQFTTAEYISPNYLSMLVKLRIKNCHPSFLEVLSSLRWDCGF
jgi:hypothetical protein